MATQGQGADPEQAEDRAPRVSGKVAGELIVRFKPGSTEPKKAKALNKVKGKARDLIAANARIARFGAKPSASEETKIIKVEGNVEAAQRTLENDPDVLYVEPNFKARVFAPVFPNDFEFEALYGLHNTGANGGRAGADVKAPEAWELTTGSREIVVAVIDTGVDYFHEDLRANIWTNPREIPGNGIDDDGNGYIDDVHGYDFVSNDADPFDDHFHGTHVSGTIGASGNNGIGVAGVCWQVQLMAVKAFNEQGNGDVVGAVSAIHYAIANGARVINASWGLEDRSRALADAVADAQAAGIVFVAAAGNSRTATPFYPAGYDSVIAVASLNNKDERSQFSNFGPHVDISAPGEQILSTVPDGKYDAISGTSMAAPHVAGAAALILSRHPEFTPAQITTILKNTTDFVRSDRAIGRGRLNVFNAIQIEAPLPNAALKIPNVMKGRVSFRGTAAGQRFQRYALSYGIGSQPTEWTQFGEVTASVSDGVLFSDFDSSILNDGTYTFKVEVWNDNGQSASDMVTVQVLNVQLAFPLSSDILRAGVPLQLKGSVFGQGRHFGLEWSKGLAPIEWFTNGFTIPANGEVLDGVLGTFDTSLVDSNEFYSFRLSATNAAGQVQQFYANFIWLDSHLRPGWPIYLPYEGDYSIEDWRQAKVADLDGDGHKEIVIVDHGNAEGKVARLLVFRDDATLAWSRDLNGDEPFADVPLLADMDGDDKMEIFVDVGSLFYGFTYDGKTLPGVWPVDLTAKRLGKIAADLDGDGKLEIVALANEAPENSFLTSLAVYDREGHALQRWTLTACGATNISQRAFPVAANMDSDPELEIVIVSGCSDLQMFDINSPNAVWTAPLTGSAFNTPVLADIDHDGATDIVVTSWTPGRTGGGVFLFNNRGQIAPGWPVLTEDAILTSPAVGDLDGDGLLEICVAGDRSFKLHVLELDGFEAAGWPKSISNMSTAGAPGIVDINGDGRLDVVYTAPGYMNLALSGNDPTQLGGIAAWSANGVQIPLNRASRFLTIPLEGSTGPGFSKASPVTITDLDGNGKMDLVAASVRDRTYVPAGQSAALKNRSTLYAWELDVPAQQQTHAWPEFQHAANNNAFLATPKPQPQPPEIASIGDQIVAIGQPFPAIPLDQFLIFPGEAISNLTWRASGQIALVVDIDTNSIARVTAPTPDWEGSERITFEVTDGSSFTRSVDVVFAKRRNFVPPVAVTDEITVAEDNRIEIDLLANDGNPVGGPLRLISVSIPTHGQAAPSNGRALYVPETNFFGDDTFTYVVENDSGARALGTALIHVTAINDLPLATDDRALTFEDRSVTIDVLLNDKDADLDPLSIVALTAPSDGSALVNGNKVVFQPRAGFNGTNVFFYSVTDGKSAPQQAKITVLVRPLNNPPVAKPQTIVMNRNTTKDIIYLADDLEGDPVTFRIIRPPAHGELFSFPTLGSYTPQKGYSGQDSFSYKASDGQVESAEASVTITITATNNPPTATTLNLMTRINQAVSITLTATDPDDDPVTFTVLKMPAHGFLDGSGSNYIYTPNLNYLGKDEFTYIISDGTAETIGKVGLETTDKNTAPGANVKFVKTTPNTPAIIVLSGADAESNPLTFHVTAQPKHGTLSGDAPYLQYTPNTDYVGPDRFRFDVSDGEFTSDPAPVTISIATKNTLPTASNQTVTMPVGGPAFVELNAHDADGDSLEVVILKGPRSGRLFGSGTNFKYTPSANFGVADVFTYKPWDGRNFGPETQVRIEQSSIPPNTPPGFDGAKLTTAGVFQLSVTNQFGKPFRIDSSTNFTDWTVVTNVLSSPGRFLFNANATNAQIFFRAVQ